MNNDDRANENMHNDTLSHREMHPIGMRVVLSRDHLAGSPL